MTSTLPRPGSIILNRGTPPSSSVPTDTGQAFWTGFTDRGPSVPKLLRSLTDFVNVYGSRQAYSPLYDAVEYYFKEGGARLWMSRVLGPAALLAHVDLLDGVPVVSLTVKAKGFGAYANTLRITITGGGGATPFVIQVSDTVLGVLETSPSLADQAAAVSWSQSTSLWIDITIGVGVANPVAVAAAPLAGGTDDRVSAIDANWAAAGNKFPADLGPGQHSQVGRTTLQAQTDMLAHCKANNRWAVIDLPDTVSAATLKAAGLAIRALGANGRYGFGFGPWPVVPGLIPNTTRVVPPCAFVCGRISGNESKGQSPNVPSAATPAGILTTPIGLSQPAYDNGSGIDITRDDLYSSGVNLIVYRYGVFQIFGWRSFVDPVGTDQDWVNAGNGRLNMAISAKATAIAERYILKEIDGQGRLLAQFQGDLIGMLKEYWLIGSLYGLLPEEAFNVNVGDQVNTLATIANRELHAVISCRMSQDSELVIIEIAKVPVNQSL